MIFGTEFWSAISGAVVGGVIALIVQLITINAAKKERLANKNEVREALAHSLMFKAIRIHSNLYNLHLHLEESFAKIDPSSHDEPCTFVLPLASSPDDVHFSAEEMSLILSLKDPDLTDRMMSLDAIHNNLIDVFETYRDLRADIQPLLPAEMEGNVGIARLTEEQMMVVRPKMVMMNQLIQAARERAKEDYEDSKVAVDKLPSVLNDKLSLELKVEIKAEKLAALDKAKKQQESAI